MVDDDSLFTKEKIRTLNNFMASFWRLSEVKVVSGAVRGSLEYNISGCLHKMQSEITIKDHKGKLKIEILKT